MPRAGLDRDAVTRLALDVVDADGWPALTLAAVAGRAGVAVPSLYKHVEGLPGLRLEVARACVEELTATLLLSRGDATGASALRAMVAGIRRFALARPGRYLATQGDWARDTAAQEVHRAAAATIAPLLEAVAQLGIPAEHRIDAVRSMRAAVHGFVLLELAGGFGMPDDVDQSFAYLVDRLLAGLTHP